MIASRHRNDRREFGLRAPLAVPLVVVLAAGCASFDGLAPKAVRTDPAVLAASHSLAGAKLSPAAWPSAAWWRRFGDPQLDALIGEALAGNPGMGSARARVDRAVALAAVSGAALAPQASAGADLLGGLADEDEGAAPVLLQAG